MTRVVVVHHDPDMADQETDWLRQAGFEVDECAGPSYGPCPILRDEPCPAVEGADVLVYDVWASGDSESERELIERLRDLHPDIPLVLTSPGIEFDWVQTAGAHGVVPLDGAPSAASLKAAVERALTSIRGKGTAPAA